MNLDKFVELFRNMKVVLKIENTDEFRVLCSRLEDEYGMLSFREEHLISYAEEAHKYGGYPYLMQSGYYPNRTTGTYNKNEQLPVICAAEIDLDSSALLAEAANLLEVI